MGIWIKMVSLFLLRHADLITVTNHYELNKLSNEIRRITFKIKSTFERSK